jgi:hypothetical protein
MAASRSVLAFSVVPSSNPSRQESKQSIHSHAAEAEVFAVCTRAGVSAIGLTSDRVLFQPVVATLSIPLAEFADPERAIALIRAKLGEVGR